MFPGDLFCILSKGKDLASVDLIMIFLHLWKLALSPMNFYVI